MTWFAFGERDKSALDKMLPCRDDRLSWNTEVITYPCSGTGKGHLPETLVAFIHKTSIPPKGSHASIRNFSAKKAFTPSHRARFCLIYNGFECEGFDFKVFTRSAKCSHGRWTLVKGWKSKPSHRETASQSGGNRHQRPPYAVNTWNFKPSHSKPLKIMWKHTPCEVVNAF